MKAILQHRRFALAIAVGTAAAHLLPASPLLSQALAQTAPGVPHAQTAQSPQTLPSAQPSQTPQPPQTPQPLPAEPTAQPTQLAQSASPAVAPLPAVVVTGNPLRSAELATPATVLQGDALVLRRASTLGETLDGLPGVSSSYFGPNANRPVLRGQDGDRVRMLGNGGASLDASSLSFDHAVPIDPLVVERIEVLRGPAALLYGGSAVGGVVNAIDNRIPRAAVGAPTGAAEVRFGGAAAERGVSALVEAGGSGFALHADAFRRRTSDLRVPAFDRPLGAGAVERRERIVNSGSEADGGALGGSAVWAQGHLGLSVDRYRNTYGIVAEEDVTIRMQRDKLVLAGEVRDLDGPVRTLRGHWQRSVYRHEEVEGSGEVGTTFDNQGIDARLEAEHAAVALPFGTLRGVVGLQAERVRFSALGEEAFVPATRTRQTAAFLFEELVRGELTVSLGGRAEHTRVDSIGDAAGAAGGAPPRFGPADSRSFDTASAALGAVYRLSPAWQASGNLAYTERAPTYAELYANGVHIATAAFERGNAGAAKEKGANVDLALQWKQGESRIKAGVFASRFANYIALTPTGEPDVLNDDGEAFPVYAFTAVPARFSGVELEGATRLLDGAQRIELDAKLDATRASNRATGEPLPRIAPLRASVGLGWGVGGWSTRAELVRAWAQSRVPATDVRTAGYTLVNLSLSRVLRWGGSDGLLFVRLTNLGDALGYNAASIGSVRALAPLPGRAVAAGLRVSF